LFKILWLWANLIATLFVFILEGGGGGWRPVCSRTQREPRRYYPDVGKFRFTTSWLIIDK
jgi:hypothetical protein